MVMMMTLFFVVLRGVMAWRVGAPCHSMFGFVEACGFSAYGLI